MPADSGARTVFVDQDLREGARRPSGEGGDLGLKGRQKVRNRRRLHYLAAFVVVAQAKADHPPIGEMAMEIESLEGQVAKTADEVSLLIRSQEIRLVAKSFEGAARRSEQVRLLGDRRRRAFPGRERSHVR